MSLAPRKNAYVLLHAPTCSKSRQLKAALVERGIDFDERRYLDEPLSKKEIGELLELLGVEPHALLRTKEAEHAVAGLSPDSSKKAVVDALAAHPRLLERPILIAAGRAAIGRPTEAALELVD